MNKNGFRFSDAIFTVNVLFGTGMCVTTLLLAIYQRWMPAFFMLLGTVYLVLSAVALSKRGSDN